MAAPVRCCRGPASVPAAGRRCHRDPPTGSAAAMSRSYNDELQYLDKIDKNCWRIKKGFVPNMRVRGTGPGCPGWGSGRDAESGSGRPGQLTALPAGGGRFLRERPAGEADVRGAAQCLPRRRWVRRGADLLTPGVTQNQSVWKRPLRSSSSACDQVPPCQLDCGTECSVHPLLERFQDGDPAASLGSPFQRVITLSAKTFLLMSKLNLSRHNLTLTSCPVSPHVPLRAAECSGAGPALGAERRRTGARSPAVRAARAGSSAGGPRQL